MKEKYVLPTMADIRCIKWNGLKVASLFAGIGGSSLGYRMAGFRVVWACEIAKHAAENYRLNCDDHTVVCERDIRNVDPVGELGALGINPGELDVLDGSPPCQAFSTAGNREQGWGRDKKQSGGQTQRNEDMFEEYIRFVRALRPKVIVAENVSGMSKGTCKGMFIDVLKRLKNCGYRTTCRMLDAQWLDVPQCRQRLIFVGMREDLKNVATGESLNPVHPSPLKRNWTVRDVFPYLSMIQTGEFSMHWRDTNRVMGTIVCYYGFLKNRCQVEERGIRRQWTIDECKTLCSFPSDFNLTGTYVQQWEGLGNSVPPMMMYHIAKTLKERVFDVLR